MLKIIVTGANGQLGSEIKSLAPHFREMDFTFTDIEELDVSNHDAVSDYFNSHSFQVLINCAGYTAVDKAEVEQEMAMRINDIAVRNLLAAAIRHNCYPVHISTDYVFSGNHYRPYTEDEVPDPVSAYGRSKLEGEKVFLQHASEGIIIRTSWLYSSFGNNFVKTILKAGAAKSELRVVSDQVGSPTYARDLAHHLLGFIPKAMDSGKSGIYHYSNEGVCSWYDLALEAIQIKGLKCKVIPIRTEEFPTLAKRPFYSLLDKNKIKREFGITIPHWKESLNHCLEAMKDQD